MTTRTGSKSGKVTRCSACQGTGYVSRVMNMGGFITRSQSVCPQCHGNGEFIATSDLCHDCKGQKVKKEMEELEVVVEPGRKQGDKIILQHKANEYPGAMTGDLVLIIQELADPVFKRSGMDLLMKKKISLADSLCGCSIPLKHVNGEEFLLKSSKEDIIQPFGVRYIDDLGMPVYNQKNKFGKLYVQFEVEMPKALTETQKKILQLVLNNKENEVSIKSEEVKKEPEEVKKEPEEVKKENEEPKKESLKDKLFKKTACKQTLGEKIKEDLERKVHAHEEKKEEVKKEEEEKKDEKKESSITECLLKNCDQQVYGNRALWDV